MEKYIQNYYEFNGLNEAEEVAKAKAKEEKNGDRGAKYDAYRKKILAKYGDGDETKMSKEDRIKFNKEVDDGWVSREEEAAKKK